MYVVKRSGRTESVKFDEITDRVCELSQDLSEKIDPAKVAQRVIQGLYDGIAVEELDDVAARVSANMATQHPDYAVLAARIAVSNLHKHTSDSFYNTVKRLYTHTHASTGQLSSLVSRKLYEVTRKHARDLDQSIKYERDFQYDYFGFKTLERSYLLRLNHRVAERPQHMLMRVALGIHEDDLERALETYHLMSQRWFTHATPTLFNAGTPNPQLASCFLLTMKDDSIEGIYDTLKQCAKISQAAGGIGLSIHNIRATGSRIRGTNGTSNGIVPMLRNFDMTARYVDQGGGKRKGSFAIYLEPWHADIFDFLQLKKNHGKEELRARDLFYALWVPDLFMKRVENDQSWSLFCPNEAPSLQDTWGEQFEELYRRYEQEGRQRKTVQARELWREILETQIETGVPYMIYKDHANKKSNQQHLGTIRSSNLCAEIVEYTSPDEVAVCNLASLSLPKFVSKGKFDHARLFEVVEVVTKNLNQVIDLNDYPVPEAENSNLKHRPIGIGVQGLADTFLLLRHPFDSPEAKQLNKEIFETLYFAALTASKNIAKELGYHESYPGSPLSKGLFQFDLWPEEVEHSGRWNWDELRKEIKQHGVRNSLLVAPMPTASTSQILGNNECFEPFTANAYVRRVISGDFTVVNKYLLKDLVKLGLWNETMKQRIMQADGSIQSIEGIPDDVKYLYRTVWEIPQRAIVDMAADRGPYICQSQSLNIHLPNVTFNKLTSVHFHAWKRGLKTGMYYLRTRAAADAIKFTVDKEFLQTSSSKSDDSVSVGSALKMKSLPFHSNGHGQEAVSGAHKEDSRNACDLDDDTCDSCGS